MSQHTPNELTTIFKRDRDLITQLKMNDAHYARLADEYHEVNREVHRIECETEAASDERTEQLKRQRLALLDERVTERERETGGQYRADGEFEVVCDERIPAFRHRFIQSYSIV